ncbi:hypothetical protein AB1N83_008382 [Pleurotus pulmonarius]
MPITTAITGSSIDEYNAQIIDNSVNITNFAGKVANVISPQASSVSLCIDEVLALETAAREALRNAPRSGVTTFDILLQSDAYLQASHHRLKLLLVLKYDPVALNKLFRQYEAHRIRFDGLMEKITGTSWFKRLVSLGNRAAARDILDQMKELHGDIKSVSDKTSEQTTDKKIQQRIQSRGGG